MADVLKIEPSARFKLTRNGVNLYSQHYAPAAATYTESTADRLILATNMTVMQELNMNGVSTAEYVLVETDNTVKVAFNTTNANAQVTVGKSYMITGANITHVYFLNESTTNTATVNVVVTD